jgi:hypothetical protein
MKLLYYLWTLVRCGIASHCYHMPTALLVLLAGISWTAEAFGVWKLNPARSTPAGNEKSLTVRIQPHIRGEVFTVDTVDARGRAWTISTILYFDGKSRDFQDVTCSRTQSSRLAGTRTVEIVRECADGGQVRLVRRLAPPRLLILEITDQHRGDRHSERRLVIEKQ